MVPNGTQPPDSKTGDKDKIGAGGKETMINHVGDQWIAILIEDATPALDLKAHEVHHELENPARNGKTTRTQNAGQPQTS